MKVSRNGPGRRSGKRITTGTAFRLDRVSSTLICVVALVQLMFFYYAVNKTFCRRTSVRPQKMSEIGCNASG